MDAIKHAKTLRLASLSSDITALKLRTPSNISLGGREVTCDYVVGELVVAIRSIWMSHR